jgi:hypothetical protein
MEDLGDLIVGLVKVFVFIIKIVVNIVAEIFTTFLALFCLPFLWKWPMLFKCYEGCSFDLDEIWSHRIKVVQCFFDLLVDILCLPAVFFSIMCLWRCSFVSQLWSGDVGEWRVRAWQQFSLGVLDFVCMPALVLSSPRICFLINGCEKRDSEAHDWDSNWRFEVWRQAGLLLLDLLCLPAILLTFPRWYFLIKASTNCDANYDWSFTWRMESWRQGFLLLLDLSCLPVLALCPTRWYFLYKACKNNKDDKVWDWSFNWRSEAWRQAGLLLLDLLCLPAILLTFPRWYFLIKASTNCDANYDWSFTWRMESWRQGFLLLLDLSCLPVLALCPTRWYFLYKACKNNKDDKVWDWSFNWRSEAWRQAGLLLLDLICLPALVLCLASVWRWQFLFASPNYERYSDCDWNFNWRFGTLEQFLLASLDVIYFPFFIMNICLSWRWKFLLVARQLSIKRSKNLCAATGKSNKDWLWRWRSDCLHQVGYAFLDALCALPLLISVLSWRRSFFFGGYRAREALERQNDAAAAAATTVAAAANDVKHVVKETLDWPVDWRSECWYQLRLLIQDAACFPFFLCIVFGPWRIPFFLAGSRSRPNVEHNKTNSADHDWPFCYRSELCHQAGYFILDLFSITPVLFCIVSWRYRFVKEMYQQELKEMASSANKSDFPGNFRLRCLQQVGYLFLDICMIPFVLLLVLSIWRWGYIQRGLQSGNESNSSSGSTGSSGCCNGAWPYDWTENSRSFLLYQVRCMCLDLLCAPFVACLVLCPWRIYTFGSSLRNPNVVDFKFDSVTDHPSCWRYKALANILLMLLDIISFPFLILSICSWRNVFFFRSYRCDVLKRITAGAKSEQIQVPSPAPRPDGEVSMGDLVLHANSFPSSPVSQQIAPNTANLISASLSEPQDPSILQQEQNIPAFNHDLTHNLPVSVPEAPTIRSATAAVQISALSGLDSSASKHDSLPWFDPDSMDWNVSWRRLSVYQTNLLFGDFLTLPFLALYLVSAYRMCLFPLPLSELFAYDPISFAGCEDWNPPVRCLLMNHGLCILFDVLCFPFFVVAKSSWRGHTILKSGSSVEPEYSIPISDAQAVPYNAFQNIASPISVTQPSQIAPSQFHSHEEPISLPQSENKDKPETTSSVITSFRHLFLNQVNTHI